MATVECPTFPAVEVPALNSYHRAGPETRLADSRSSLARHRARQEVTIDNTMFSVAEEVTSVVCLILTTRWAATSTHRSEWPEVSVALPGDSLPMNTIYHDAEEPLSRQKVKEVGLTT